MKTIRYFLLFVLVVSFVMLISCGEIDGQYMQLESPF